MNQRGSVLPAVAFLFGAAVVVLIFGYMLWPKDSDLNITRIDVSKVVKNENANSNTNANTNANVNAATNANANTNTAADPTAGWKTYTLENTGLTFKYPPSWGTVKIQTTEQPYQGNSTVLSGKGTEIGFTNNSKITLAARSDDLVGDNLNFVFTGGPMPTCTADLSGKTCSAVTFSGQSGVMTAWAFAQDVCKYYGYLWRTAWLTSPNPTYPMFVVTQQVETNGFLDYKTQLDKAANPYSSSEVERICTAASKAGIEANVLAERDMSNSTTASVHEVDTFLSTFTFTK